MEVSNNIRAIRERKGLTQADVAAKMNTERSNYARLENRDTNLTLRQLQEIATALEVSIHEIIGLPQAEGLREEQTEKIERLEERLKATENALKEKKRNIKLYKSFIEWTRQKFIEQYTYSTLGALGQLKLREVPIEKDEDLDINSYQLTEDELKSIGDYLFSIDAPTLFVNEFVASTGFVKEKWFIDAYKRASRKRKEKVAFAEVKNWVDGVFEFLEEE